MTTGYEDFRQTSGTVGGPVSGVPFWGDNGDAWDTIFFGGTEAPGLARVMGAVKSRVDHKSLPGTNGMRTTHIGYEAAEVDVELRIWMPEHLSDWTNLVRTLRPRKGAPKAITVSHPSLTMYDVRSVTVMELSLPERDDGGDFYKIKMKLREYVPTGNQKAKVETTKFDLTTIPHAINVGTGAAAAPTPSQANASDPFPDITGGA